MIWTESCWIPSIWISTVTATTSLSMIECDIVSFMITLFKRLSSSAAGVFVLAFYRRFNDANVALLAAGLAYYAAFSLGPLTLIFTSFLAGFLQGRPDLAAEYQVVLVDLLKQVLPVQVDSQALIVNSINVVVSQMGDGAIFRNLLSFLILLWAGTNFFTVLQLALEVIFSIENARAYWRKRIVSIILLVAVALVIAFEVFWSLFSSFLTYSGSERLLLLKLPLLLYSCSSSI